MEATSTPFGSATISNPSSCMSGSFVPPPNHLIPNAPNWYCSQIADCSFSDLYAFGSKNSIYLLNLKTRKFQGILSGHENRITAIEFSHSLSTPNLLVSAALDRKLQVWNTAEMKSVVSSTGILKADPTCISISPLISELIVSGDTSGTICVWRFEKNVTQTFLPLPNVSVCSVSCSPTKPLEVAVGFQNGLILILHVTNGEVLKKFTEHTDEVQCLRWMSPPATSASLSSAPVAAAKLSAALPAEESSQNIPITQSPSSSAESEKWPRGQKGLTTSSVVYLTSSSRDRTIRVWNLETERMFKSFSLPQRSSATLTENQKTRLWIALAVVPESNLLIASTHMGELLMYSISGKGSTDTSPRRFSTGHTRPVFSISFLRSSPSQSSSNTLQQHQQQQQQQQKLFITTSMDRQILLWDVASLKRLWCIHGLGGFCYSLDSSPNDPGRIAAAIGDNTIRIWNTLAKDPYETVSLWKGIQSKVTVVSWHPSEMGLLAFGTEDGRVGLYEVFSQRYTALPAAHRNATVYELSWRQEVEKPSVAAMPLDDSSSPQSSTVIQGHPQVITFLYSCAADGQIFEFQLHKTEMHPLNLNEYITKGNAKAIAENTLKLSKRSEIAWNRAVEGKPLLVAVGNTTGSVELFVLEEDSLLGKSLRRVRFYNDHKALVNRIRWNPILTNIFASASDDHSIRVYDTANVFTKDQQSVAAHGECLHCFSGFHTAPVISLCWSPHTASLLLSGSADQTAQLWDAIEKKAPLTNLRGHEGRVFACTWSYAQKDVMFTGGDDQTIRKWDLAENPSQFQTPPASQQISSSAAAVVKKTAAKASAKKKEKEKEKEMLSSTVVTEKEKESASSASASSSSVHPLPPPEETSTKVPTLVAEPAAKKKQPSSKPHRPPAAAIASSAGSSSTSLLGNVKSLLPSANVGNETRLHAHDASVGLAKWIYQHEKPPGSEKNTDISLLWAPSEEVSMDQLLNVESSQHIRNGQQNAAAALNFWAGNVPAALSNVISAADEESALDPNWIALSAAAGKSTWAKMCALYAQQLERKGNFHDAVMYHLALSNVEDAIAVYKRANMWREAIGLARVRLLPDDPLLVELYLQYGEVLEEKLMPDQAAKWYQGATKEEIFLDNYLAAKFPIRAIEAIAKKGDLQGLSTALRIAQVCSQKEEIGQLVGGLAISVSLECAAADEFNQGDDVITRHRNAHPLATAIHFVTATEEFLTLVCSDEKSFVMMTSSVPLSIFGKDSKLLGFLKSSQILSLFQKWNEICEIFSEKAKNFEVFTFLRTVFKTIQISANEMINIRKRKKWRFEWAISFTKAFLSLLFFESIPKEENSVSAFEFSKSFLSVISEFQKRSNYLEINALFFSLFPNWETANFLFGLLESIESEKGYLVQLKAFHSHCEVLRSYWSGKLPQTFPHLNEIVVRLTSSASHLEYFRLQNRKEKLIADLREAELKKQTTVGVASIAFVPQTSSSNPLMEILSQLQTITVTLPFPDPFEALEILRRKLPKDLQQQISFS